MTRPDLSDFVNDVGPVPGNTPWAQEMAATVRSVVARQAAGAARNVQQHLGPSELGARCDRQVVAKMTMPKANTPSDDCWPSVVGTAVHAWLADAFTADDPGRWVTEHRVTPFPDHPGTADLYDGFTRSVLDHKVLGDTSMSKLRQEGPSRLYTVQLALYGLGCARQGLVVERVALIAYPRQGSSLAGIYVHEITADIPTLLREVREDLRRREAYASQVGITLDVRRDVPATPGEDCHFCPIKGMCDVAQ